jgi:hypothetical protein
MEEKVVRAQLLNNETPADSVLTAGYVYITGWFPIKQTNVLSAIKITSTPEVKQVVTITSNAAITPFTIYQVAIGNTGNRREGAQTPIDFFSATAPALLSGNAAQDKHNIYIALAKKINQTPSAHATAGSVITIAHAATVGTFIFNEVVTGGTSGAKGYLVLDAAGVLTIANYFGDFISGETITGQTSGATALTTAPPTIGLGLRITDTGLYFSSYTKGFLQGPNTVLATRGWGSLDLVITTAGVISRGIGTRLVDDVPKLELLSSNLAQGLFSFPTTEAIIAANNYTEYIVVDYINNVPNDAAAGTTVAARRVQVLYVNEGAPGYAAFQAVMLTNFPTMVNSNGVPIAPAYSLGLATTYVILTGGALTVGTPAQPVNGDIGQAGAIIGSVVFTSGADYPAPASTPAVNDAANTYATLTGLTPTFSFIPGAVVLETVDVGNGPGIFHPGIFKGTGAAGTGAGGTVTFSGVGDYVFIFPGAITTGANTTFVLLNGAVASRIFFASGAALTTGANTIWKGNSLSPAGQTTGANTQLEGRLLSTAAAAISTGAGAGTYVLPTS